MSRICFLIPDGVGIRNYLYSDVIKNLSNQGHEIIIWHSLASEVIRLAADLNGYHPLEKNFKVFKEDLIVQILRESSTYARLKHNAKLTDNPTIMLNWHEKKGPFRRKALVSLSEFLGGRISGYEGIESTEKIYFSRIKRTEAYKQYWSDLKEINPEVLYCTHQRYPGAAFAMEAAKSLGIRTVTGIFSWDNLPKARLLLRSDYYTVWSPYMKSELMFYYPEIKENQIFVTGTPQFDFYAKEDSIQSRDDFAKAFGLDPNKKWVCFSGSDAKTSPNDTRYLEDVAEALKDEEDVQLLFRQVPVETAQRYESVLSRYPEIKHLPPIWNKGKHWNQFYPFPEDISHLVNLSYHCATVINIGSTMALDFSWFNSPGLYLNYDHEPNQEWTVRDVYKFQHFRSMDDLNAVVWANSKQEIKSKVKEILNHPDKVAKDRNEWLRIITGDPTRESASSRISSLLEELSQTSEKVF
ncbi:hypothetical protein [Algoriphagus sediminis]|uniref:UDP-glycosyltransferase n=1 Tax=Algoriphagus sediminis TaxID=3057113 RepID=A0ABT7YDX9_9BACT|nr:hypothetical protein [Algoriphagus sediminis]MDN3204741.1 hypothetical protein [Algoriphagus sediminis]